MRRTRGLNFIEAHARFRSMRSSRPGSYSVLTILPEYDLAMARNATERISQEEVKDCYNHDGLGHCLRRLFPGARQAWDGRSGL